MAKLKVTMRKTGGSQLAPPPQPRAGDAFPADGSMVLLDHENGSFTVLGVTKGGNEVDISGVATLTVTSDNESILMVDEVTDMLCKTRAVGPAGDANLTCTATWADGSIGPFEFLLPAHVVPGPVAGIKVKLDAPVPR